MLAMAEKHMGVSLPLACYLSAMIQREERAGCFREWVLSWGRESAWPSI
jgi:hypothetical protein